MSMNLIKENGFTLTKKLGGGQVADEIQQKLQLMQTSPLIYTQAHA